MKVSKRDISIVMILLGAIALFCVYQFNYRKAVAKAEELQKEIDTKTEENNNLLKIDEQALENEMIKWEESLVSMVQKYPARYHYDDMIMYLYDLEHTDEYGVHFSQYALIPSTPKNTYIGKFRDKGVNFASTESKFTMNFSNASYEGCKKMLTSIFAETQNRAPKNFDSITLTYDNLTGTVIGQIVVNAYCVSDFGSLGRETNYPQAEVIVPLVDMGVECVFGPTVTPLPTITGEITPEP